MEPRSELLGIIRQVRRRWRMKLAFRGGVGVLASLLCLLLVAAYGLEAFRFSPAAIVAFRILLVVALVASTAAFLLRPMLRRVTDEQVALYLEEHEPSLNAAIVSAVDAGRRAGAAAAADSAALVTRLVEMAVEKCRSVGGGREIERLPLRRSAGALAAAALVGAALFTFGPGYLRHALPALMFMSQSAEAAAPYRIEVSPGNTTLPRGADQTVLAALQGFEATDAGLMVRQSPDARFERLPMVRISGSEYEGLLFNLAGPIEYFVDADGVRSPVFRIEVVDVPYVQRLELEYHFPAYTGLLPQTIEYGGDIAVLTGTEVRVRAISTMPVAGGRIVLHESTGLSLEMADDGSLETRFVADRDGFYRIELETAAGEYVTASPQYTIDVLTDQSPLVSFLKPGRDVTVSPLEEYFIQARARDDFGVRDLELIYSVNGGPEERLTLFGGQERRDEVIAGHTFYLEELDVEPGDFVSYYASASDNDTVGGPKQATSDLYFLRVRPLDREFREAQSQASGGGMGGGGEVGALSEQQRQIISATFNVRRDRATYTPERLRESTIVIALSQARLREQVEGLVERMNSRLVSPDPAFRRIAELLPQAVEAMKEAEEKLRAVDPDGALPPEQRALQFLQRAEEEYELQVSMSQNAGGGGGAGSIAEDLADLFEMDLDRNANQYELAPQVSAQETDQQLDELMERLRELARRQEQEAARQQRRAAAGSPSGGGAAQRALAEQVEEAARRLERLSREENRPDLMESARRLAEAADAMRRAAAGGDAGAAASTALERLREAERQLERLQAARAEDAVRDAQRRADELAREQAAIADEVAGLAEAGQERQARVAALSARKKELESDVAELERQLDRTAVDLGRDERDASRRLAEAAGSLRDNRVRDKIRYSDMLIRSPIDQAGLTAFEGQITEHLEEVRDRIGQAASALGQSTPDPMAEALERARQLAHGFDSLEARTRERAAAAPSDSEAASGAESAQQTGQQPGEGQQAGRGDPASQGEEAGGAALGDADGAGGAAAGALGSGDTAWGWGYGGGFIDRRPGRLSPEDIRQFRGEVQQWTAEVEQLRRLLREQDLDPRELDEILRRLRELDDLRVYQDAAELLRLQSFVAEALKRFEFDLRRRLDEGASQALLSGSAEVPEEFRPLVEQYYRSLAEQPE